MTLTITSDTLCSMKEILAILAAIFAILGNMSYFKDVLKGHILPHPYTWFIWSIVSFTTFFGGVAKGAGIGALPTGVAEVFTILIFLYSLRYVHKGIADHIQPIDHYFLGICLLGLLPWFITKDPTLSVITVVAIDIIAFMPTLRKTWKSPHSERPTLFLMNLARHVLTLFALQTYNIATTLHSIAMIGLNSLMTYVILRNKN